LLKTSDLFGGPRTDAASAAGSLSRTTEPKPHIMMDKKKRPQPLAGIVL
jgi:hypothetical protein